MVVMGIYFVYRTQPWWRKTKEQQPWNNTKQIFPEQKAKKAFALRHLCPLHEVLSGIGNTYINMWTNCQFIWSGIVYIWLSDFQKLFLWQQVSTSSCKHWLLFLNNTNPIKIPEHPFQRQSTGFKFTPTKRRLSTSHIPILELVLKPALPSYTI